jgi:hypothetical protein
MRVWPSLGLLALLAAPVAAQDDAAALLAEIDAAGISNAYLPFARFALTEAAKRERGGAVRSAVLVPMVSLVDPKAMACDTKPMAIIVDLDVAPGTPAEMDVEPQSGFAFLLDSLRAEDIRIAWLAESSEARLQPITALLREGEEPVMRDEDIMLVGLPSNYSKQERRQQLARDYCIVAIAGDRKSDFDELYDYLRDQSYAIRLEAYMDRGWFLLPHPVTAIDSERLAISPEQKVQE